MRLHKIRAWLRIAIFFTIVSFGCHQGRRSQPQISVSINPDTMIVNQKMLDSSKNLLLVFTGWACDAMGILDTNSFHDNRVSKLLGDADVMVFFVDDRVPARPGGPPVGEINMKYQQDHFHSVVQSEFIFYKRSVQVCTDYLSIRTKGILKFFEHCSDSQ